MGSTTDGFCDIEIPEKKTASLLIVGRAGAGKTALVNSIANKEVGKEMDGLDSETTKLMWYEADRAGVDIEMWDTPGLQGNDSPDLRRLL